MELSRWGRFAEEALSAPVPTPTLSEIITKRAEQEIEEQTSALLCDGLNKLLFATFGSLDLRIISTYNPMVFGFVIQMNVRVVEKIYTATALVRDEDIDNNTGSVTQWSRYMHNVASQLRSKIRLALLDDGIHEIPMGSPLPEPRRATEILEERDAVESIIDSIRRLETN